jgi:hypothetical protein
VHVDSVAGRQIHSIQESYEERQELDDGDQQKNDGGDRQAEADVRKVLCAGQFGVARVNVNFRANGVVKFGSD